MPGNSATNFCYKDPIDGSETRNQGYVFRYPDGSRFLFRLEPTLYNGAIIRLYLEKYSHEATYLDPSHAL